MIARRLVAAFVCGAFAAGGLMSTALAQEPVQEAPPPSAEQLSLLSRLDAARATIARLQAASNRAEYERAEAEAAVVAAHQELASATYALELAGAAVTTATQSLEASQRERLAAQVLLDADAATTYKFNGARGAALMFELLGSTDDPNAFARDLYALESVMVHRQQEVAGLIADVAAATQRLETLMAVRGSAYLWQRQAEEAVEVAEEQAALARTDAADAEERLLAAAELALTIELEAAQAQVQVPPAPPGADIPAPGSVLEVEHPVSAPAVAAAEPESLVGEVVEQAAAVTNIDFAATREQVELRQEWLLDRSAELDEERGLDPAMRRAYADLTCPVAGAEFSNDWHYPRSHGRRHKGIDMLAPLDTPVLAIADATITVVDRIDAFDGDSDLGGIAVTYETEVGRFYASHLDGIPEDLEEGQQVAAGDVVGWIGNSGNAQGGPHHLHLGWYWGESAINPFPTMALVCPPSPDERSVQAPVH